MAGNLEKKIYVTRPSLPPLDDVINYLESIWQNRILTNNGSFHQKFEKELSVFLGVPYVSLVSNGTLGLLLSLKALDIDGEVITTPFSFVATAHSILWNNLKPVFVDIEPETFTINPSRIEEAITKNTTAILPVHVYGFPCRVEEIERIALKHKLKVVYDAAHTFGARFNGKSLCSYGDISVLSFHATKVFNTFEGGAIICRNEKLKKRVDNLKNFGITSETTIEDIGINAKMNEFQSAMGVIQLKYFDETIKKRKLIFGRYISNLSGIRGIKLPRIPARLVPNYAYFPVLVDGDNYHYSRDELYSIMKKNNIYCRRYFYPLISNIDIYKDFPSANKDNLPVANHIAGNILCLPIYPDMSLDEVDMISGIIKKE